ncbi:tRNA uridine-5-carboxymethylaminomethyl(34) synthesis GTPase MnmE [Microscilla marina]|uniref:tRNA modification GTPase MnmE n=1 Tax=Microscilla marina ATCC 23134 TaxID=313606 RepID=A1ZQU5_MICM2|nr:tRNA uridine-5-carboxymethylaminomethyl(34) synthesis GTPase MnmE [Microscilla marina]EAY27250.1 tRNA modification GTPase TrmE [Microscilla marina ATCC 23134]
MNPEQFTQKEDTIVALSTPSGSGAIGVIRVSGKDTFAVCDQVFYGKTLSEQASHTVHFGTIRNDEGQIIDEVVAALFKAPRSFTKEDVIEVSCHGSQYIIQQVIQLLIGKGARLAKAGEFTQRAYLNGRMDLAQAEAIADLIASDSKAAHQVAMKQMRGGFSKKITQLREEFTKLAALLELELDFSEEDVEFANRDEMQRQLNHLKTAVTDMAQSFALGNAIKNGVPVAIVGKPNAGKSTLLNALLQEDKAIVSAIPGTTRDSIEDEVVLEGIRFRFIDTAGLRETADEVESIGIARAFAKMKESQILLYMFDAVEEKREDWQAQVAQLQADHPDTKVIVVANKIDEYARFDLFLPDGVVGCGISAKEHQQIDRLQQLLIEAVQAHQLSNQDQVIVTNLRHYEALQDTLKALAQVQQTLDLGLSTEMVASDIRTAIYHLGEITGQISNNDLLEFIFSKFCIGK